MLFSELGLSEEILKAVEKIGYEEATEIQAKTIPDRKSTRLNSSHDL